MGKKVQICYVVNRNEDFFGHFCINFVPWWCKHTIFLGYTNYLYMNLDYKNYSIWQQHFPCVYLHILDAILTLFAPVMHRQSCLPSGLTVAAPDAFGRIPGVVTSRLWLVGREATTDTPLWPGKSVVFTRVSHLPELVFSLLIKIQEMYSDTLKEDIFLYQTI